MSFEPNPPLPVPDEQNPLNPNPVDLDQVIEDSQSLPEKPEVKAVFPLQQIRRFRGKSVQGVEITDDDLLASSVEARPELQEAVNSLIEKGFSSTQILDQALENQDFLNSPELTPFEDGLSRAMRTVGSQLIGMIGDGIDLIDAAGKFGPRQAAKIPGLGFLDPDKQDEEIKKKTGVDLRENIQNPFVENLSLIPRTNELKAKFDELTDNKFSPVDAADAQVDEVIGDFAALVLPTIGGKAKVASKAPSLIKGVGQLVKSLVRPAVQVAGGQAAKKGAEALGFEEGGQEVAKLAAIFMLGLRSPGSVDKFASEQQQAVRSRIPDANISAKNMVKKLNDFKAEVRRGTGEAFPEKRKLLDRVNVIMKKVKKGEISLKDVEEIIKENNEIIGDPATLQGTEARIKRVQGILQETFQEYEAIDPQLVADFREANSTFKAVKESRKALDFILKKEGIAIKEGVGANTLAAVQFRSGKPLRGLFTMGVNAVSTPIRTMQVINQTPSLQKFYLDALKAAVAGDTGAYIKNLKALDKNLEDELIKFGDDDEG